MANPGPSDAYLYLVSVNEETSMLNRQQLLGSMPKILDNLAADESLHVEQVPKSLFTQALLELRSRQT